MVGFTKAKTSYEKQSEEDDKLKAVDLMMTARIGDVLQRHYAGHAWMVEVSHKQGIAFVSIPIFMGRYKYVLKLADLKSDPTLKSVVQAGGEILERYKLPRQGFSLEHFLTALDDIPHYLRGHHGKVPT